MGEEKDRIIIDLSAMEEFSSPPIWKKAKAYYEEGRVGRLIRLSESSFSARIEGSKGQHYEASLSIHNGRIASHNCNCEAHKRYPGPCKHVVALLMKVADEVGKAPPEEEGFSQLDQGSDEGFYPDFDIFDN